MTDAQSSAADVLAVYPVDPEHGKLRAAVFGLFFVVAIGVAVLTSVIFSGGSIGLLGVIVGLIAGYIASALAERGLKGRWHSPRALQLTADGVQMRNRGAVTQRIAHATAVTPLRWKFVISKRARVPKGWWMYALSLAAPEEQITVYTFLSPQQNEAFARNNQFTRLLNRKEREKAASGAPPSLRQAGEERRLREAEEHRWLHGGELTPADFTDFLNRLDGQFQEWTPFTA